MVFTNKKREIREHYLGLLSENKNSLDGLQSNIEINLDKFLAKQEGVWLAYCAIQSEVNPENSIQKAKHITWVYPVMIDSRMEFYKADEFQVGSFGILEPVVKSENHVDLSEIDGMLIPGVVFDRAGGRLGRGKGYFDRTLADFKGTKVGLCYSLNLLDGALPLEAHDIKMNIIITENETISCK